MIDLQAVRQEHEHNMGWIEGLNNLNPWGPEQGVSNASYCDSATSMVPYHHGLRWWPHCQFKEKGCAYTVYHVNAALREGQYIYDHASKGQPAPLAIGDPVFYDWNGNGGVDHVETVAELPQGPTGNQYVTWGYNTGHPEGAHKQVRDRKYLHGVIKMAWAYSVISQPTPAPPPAPVPVPRPADGPIQPMNPYPGDTLPIGYRLNKGEGIRSKNGAYLFIMQGDGNAVVYGPNGATWSTKTTSGDFVILQGDQNLVMYQGGKAIWSPMTNGRGADRLVMQDDGNLVLYTDRLRPLWASIQGVIA